MSASITIIGSGPAGLMAAEILSSAGHAVTLYERKPSLGRKFLMAGRGGLNITHSEPLERFMTRYGAAAAWLTPIIHHFSPDDTRIWCDSLGQKTFIGSSGRVFPESFKASPLLRAWIARLEQAGVKFVMQHEWTGWNDHGELTFVTPDGVQTSIRSDATVLALGGGSWPKLGSDGSWTRLLAEKNIPLSPLRPSNCGFNIAWSDVFKSKYAGQPLKSITISFSGKTIPGDAMIGRNGIEGGAIYALSAPLRDAIADKGEAIITLDLRPGLRVEDIQKKLQTPRQSYSFSNFLRKMLNLPPVAIGLIYECKGQDLSAADLARLIKALPLRLNAPFPIDRAISTAGGIRLDALDDTLMLKQLPGVFVAGEMLDWEAPTGGYLLQASLATGFAAGHGVSVWLAKKN